MHLCADARSCSCARGGTLIEINLDIYSRQSAGYVRALYISINAGDVSAAAGQGYNISAYYRRSRRTIALVTRFLFRAVFIRRATSRYAREKSFTRFVIYSAALIQKKKKKKEKNRGNPVIFQRCGKFTENHSRILCYSVGIPAVNSGIKTQISSNVLNGYRALHCQVFLISLSFFSL